MCAPEGSKDHLLHYVIREQYLEEDPSPSGWPGEGLVLISFPPALDFASKTFGTE